MIALSLSWLVATQSYADEFLPNTKLKLESSTYLMEQYGLSFSSLEHKNLGDDVRLYLPNTNTSDAVLKLSLPNGLKLSYGEIMMFGGDIFGDPSKPISNCKAKNPDDCFNAQFIALAVKGEAKDESCSNPLRQVKAIQYFMNKIEHELAEARNNGQQDWEYYEKNNTAINKKLNKITCGGSPISAFFPFGTYIKLAEVNFDHYVPDALFAYQVGHRYALDTARQGFLQKKAGDIHRANQLLELAYAQNAFANHYLTDSFAAGHMRTPRRAIANSVFLPKVLSLLIANLMHDEDNQHGLIVVNAEGLSWTAYGDGYLHKPEAELQRFIMMNAMQRSADGIYLTFTTGKIPSTFPEMNLLPDYAKIPELNQTAPLFKLEHGALLKRIKNHDYYDYRWTEYWNGLVTLLHYKIMK